jgi:hypothetical protein
VPFRRAPAREAPAARFLRARTLNVHKTPGPQG